MISYITVTMSHIYHSYTIICYTKRLLQISYLLVVMLELDGVSEF